ncbi:MAG TPA: hypothetical protein VKM72_11655 [Thermoanaerobaculia bacterium]|nr:hypothetical protein [Thermoanaerobaculia bacterium]
MAAVTRCERFETEGLILLERGERLDGHFATCPDCREARAAYELLREQIAEAGADDEPPADWQARVRERIEQRRRRPLWGWVLAPLGAAALAAALFFAVPRIPTAPSLTQEIAPGAAVHRSASAAPGDRLVLRAETAGAPHGELRVYRNGRDLLLRCPGDSSCRREGSELRVTWTLPSAGTYQAVLVLDDEPLLAPAKSLDADAGAAFAQGAQVLLGDEISVR